jgi:DNA-binding IclR family transcriptional regulator
MSNVRKAAGVSSLPPRVIAPLARGLSLLNAFAEGEQSLGNLQLAARTGLPPSTTNRIAKSLVRLGYFEYVPGPRQYRLSPGVLALGYAAVSEAPFRAVVREHVQRFADEHHLFLAIGQRNRLEILVLECFRSNSSALTLRLDPGARVPMATTAAGWALISELPEGERRFLLTHMEKRCGRSWLEISRSMAVAFGELSRKGYCTSFGSWRPEVTSVATPLIVPEQSAALVLVCSGATRLISSKRISEEIGPGLVMLSSTIRRLAATKDGK